ncbi:MAG: hypothetical protein ACE5M4_13705 [Anaerolineales bacterium]
MTNAEEPHPARQYPGVDMVYQFNPDMLPDTYFQPGELKYIVPGNEGRLLDPRRTPFRVLDVKRSSGFFVVEILDFEDTGARWELPLESVNRCQFTHASAVADSTEIALYTEIVSRLDRPLMIPADAGHRATSEASIASLRDDVEAWLEEKSVFLKSGAPLDFSSQTGSPELWSDLKSYMKVSGLWDVEEAFAEQFVSNPNSGELVKGHRIVLAELGFVSFEGKQVRDPNVFSGSLSKQRRADHVLRRLAFVREVFERLGHSSVVLYRGLSYHGQREARENASFISATFSLEVAMSHFNDRDRESTGILLRQLVPIKRVFMSFLETAQMNHHYKEAEAILINDSANKVF